MMNDVVTIFKRDPLTHECTAIQMIAVERVGRYLHEGPKGVAFSPCGQWFGVTTVAPRILIYAIHSVE
ncbi:MAG: hypothetical protein KDK65_02275 [Chlamydiia bacterium]|nr:hypothetical protein [Chlamydiia bacterium]